MPRETYLSSVLPIVGCILAGGLLGIAGALFCPADLWLIGLRGSLTVVGLIGLLCAALVGGTWLAVMWRTRHDATFDRSADPVPQPTELLPAQAELLSLGFVPAGQTETRAGLAKAPMVYNHLAAPSDPRIVASLSFSRNRTIFASYLPDGRMIETGYPPLGLADMKVPKGWRLLPDWLLANECEDGVEAALRLQQACLAFEAARGYPALPVPGYLTAVQWENLATLRIRSFNLRQWRDKARGPLLFVPVCLLFIWMGIFATWS